MAAAKKKPDKDRFTLRVNPAWMERVEARAAHLGMDCSTFIRMVVTQYIDRADREEPLTRPPGPRRSAAP